MKKSKLYSLYVDYGADYFDLHFTDESLRNEMALSYAQEIDHANFNLNVAAWMNSGSNEEDAIRKALFEANYDGDYAPHLVNTWDSELVEE